VYGGGQQLAERGPARDLGVWGIFWKNASFFVVILWLFFLSACIASPGITLPLRFYQFLVLTQARINRYADSEVHFNMLRVQEKRSTHLENSILALEATLSEGKLELV
jgi:hypothetical protein